MKLNKGSVIYIKLYISGTKKLIKIKNFHFIKRSVCLWIIFEIIN